MWVLPLLALTASAVQAKQPPTLADLDRLVALYKELDLPIPPASAPLVRVHRKWGNQSGPYECGYLLARVGKTATIQFGATVSTVFDEHIYKVDPVEESQVAVTLISERAPLVEEHSALALAAIERSRGHNAFALNVFQRAKCERFDYPWPIGLPEPSKKTPETHLGCLAIEHWLNEIVVPESDRTQIWRELTALVKRYPETNRGHFAETVSCLGENARGPYTGTDEIEKSIDRLCDANVEGRFFESYDPELKYNFGPLFDVISHGYRVMPYLIRHFDDKRYTRAISPPEISKPKTLVTVGDVCFNVAKQIAVIPDWQWSEDRDAVVKWWEASSKKGDRQNCLERLEAPNILAPDAAIRIAEKSFPEVLVQAYDDILEKQTKSSTWPLVAAMVRSNLDRKLVMAELVKGSSSPVIDDVNAAMWRFKTLGGPAFEQSLTSALDRLPRTGNGSPENYPEAYLARIVGDSDSPKVWAALGEATRRADVHLRLELIHSSSFAEHPATSRKLFLEYLESFFSDSSKAVPKTPTQDNPFVEHHLYSLRVRDLAATVAGYELKMAHIPSVDATPSVWDAFRREVRGRIEAVVGRG